MYELCQVGKQSYYIDCPAKIGVYAKTDTDVYLIDSGSDKDAGRKVRKILEEKAWDLAGILVTHSNADHIGGCRYLQQQTGCKVFSGGIEAAFTEYPLLEPSFLYGGFPGKALRHKFLMAAASEVTDFSDADFPKEIEILPLPGHFFDMVGFRTPDGTVFLADCLSAKETLDKYGIGFLYDAEAYLTTLGSVSSMQADCFVPAHAQVMKSTEEVAALAQYNRDKVFEIAEHIAAICKKPTCFEQILQQLFAVCGLNMNFEQYVLVGSTVRSYLSWMADTGRLSAQFENHMLLWKTEKEAN